MVNQDLSHTTASLDPERINELSRAFWNSAILRAGIRLGGFALLNVGRWVHPRPQKGRILPLVSTCTRP